MATNGTSAPDPLLLLRNCIKSDNQPVPTTSTDPSTAEDVAPLETATHLLFKVDLSGTSTRHVIELNTPTRFISQRDNAPLDLLSIFFSWTNKDVVSTEYISAVQALNTERTKNGLSNVTNVVFTERVDLASWLKGEIDESEFIKSLGDTEQARKDAQSAADVARGTDDVVMGDATAGPIVTSAGEAERLKAIYKAERIIGDRNTVLHGIKPTDFSHVRKYAEPILRRSSSKVNGPIPVMPTANVAVKSTKPGRRPEPIVLLSPSASSLLRLTNIKSFLVDGIYSAENASTGANLLHITRTLPSIDPNRPTRFILVESPDNFKPDYWNRVVAVFTTGQAWQFKGYKWQNPAELFQHALGVYVGWRGELVPETVKGWGRGVLSTSVDKWREGQTVQQRWRDREVVEEIWTAIESSMRAHGWASEGR